MFIERVGVVGCGLMGSGIAEVLVKTELEVIVVEADEPAIEAGRSRIARSLKRAAKAGKLDPGEPDRLLGRIEFTTSMERLADRQLVFEAILENEDAKTALFRALDAIVTDPAAILASNTSSIPIMKLAAETSRPGSVLGVHFFNPVPVMKLVELVPSLLTSEEALEGAKDFVTEHLGKEVVLCQDRAGFIVNALLIPYVLSAIRMFESGFAEKEAIDVGMMEGCRHPMGPLQLADLIGLDTVMAVAVSLYAEFKEPLYAPPPLLSRMVQARLLGRKTGRGFYDYAA